MILKKPFLTRYSFTQDGYRRRFRDVKSDKVQFINACSDELAVYLLERRPKDLVESTIWAQQYLQACTQATVRSQEQHYSCTQ